MCTILLVDDDEAITKLLSLYLSDVATEILVASDGNEGLDFLEKNILKIRCVISDLKMPVMNGAEFICAARKSGIDTHFIFFSAFFDQFSDTLVKKCEATIVHKPDRDLLKQSLVEFLAFKNGKKE